MLATILASAAMEKNECVNCVQFTAMETTGWLSCFLYKYFCMVKLLCRIFMEAFNMSRFPLHV